MGHNTLGVIPRSVRWRRVVDLLGTDAPDATVIAATADAAESSLLRASDDPVFVEAVRLLLLVPTAARAEDFRGALDAAGLAAGDSPELLDLIMAASARLDAVRRSTIRRTDLGELAGRALATSLNQHIGDALPGLFAATPEDVQLAAKRLSSARGMSHLARGFFANITQATLSYWLERTLADQEARGGRFGALGSRDAFDAELRAYTQEASRIIKEFAGSWYTKTLHDKGGISSQDAARFGAVCLKKISAELRLKRSTDA
ncbi:hypothetical protein [Jannaschia ovalis]|uniref:Uncharacterized protein n=1 Tax=Jannaschia ovalis TaxID=3038773 RepID=A0ABY8LB84_9RHOB|nr:hypothetical protein [Jannaschia sp. GRR-S6-38]WGH78593.1 hypothetical protein P8627_16510 [Jannaschia sp. GRR-S6-38]